MLEAIFLTLGHTPEIANRYKAWRGFDLSAMSDGQQQDRLMWQDLFNDFDLTKTIDMSVSGGDTHIMHEARAVHPFCKYKIWEVMLEAAIARKAVTPLAISLITPA